MQKILEIVQDKGEFLFQIPAGLGDHIFISDAFMAVDLDFLDESADGSYGFGRREKDIGIEENAHWLRGLKGRLGFEPVGQLGLGLVELGDSLDRINFDGHGNSRTQENTFRRGFSNEVV